MTHRALHLAIAALGLGLVAAPAAALTVVFGESWDGPGRGLQDVVDARYGPGRINVRTDYIGARPGDPDPFIWLDRRYAVLQVREVSANGNRKSLGWYREPDFGPPVIDGIDDGLVFRGPRHPRANSVLLFNGDHPRIGFYLQTEHGSPGPGTTLFFTNRLHNDPGPLGMGELHEPHGGDVQALVYDVSRWTRPNTWLVCFEDRDSGFDPGPCCAGTDNDFNDLVFEVTVVGLNWGGITPVRPTSFGELKARYRE